MCFSLVCFEDRMSKISDKIVKFYNIIAIYFEVHFLSGHHTGTQCTCTAKFIFCFTARIIQHAIDSCMETVNG